jgi:hypothetical protein
MGILEFPVSRLGRGASDRAALRTGVATARPRMRVVKADAVAFCASCASPIEFGAVMHGAETYCSVECSLGGSNQPA